MNKYRSTALAAALVAASVPASSAVVVGGDNGWEVSFGGTINLFFNAYESESTSNGVVTGTADEVHLQEGLLPAFFTFKAVSPTINGLTGTAQISFAPDSSNSKLRRQDKGGSAIDMREVFFNVDGSFGTWSVGRTLGIFSRQAILKDQTLFGVGAGADESLGGAGTTLGRIGHGYVYPAFDTRFSYKTPDINGFQLEVGAYDPLEGDEGPLNPFSWETDIPRFEAEATYGTAIGGGAVNLWLGGLWQDSSNVPLGTSSLTPSVNDLTHWGLDVGGQVTFGGFELMGHYTDGENLGQIFKIAAPIYGANDTEEQHWIAQAGYTFLGKTKVAFSYGESEQKDNGIEGTNELWTVGVYHDVNSWLKIVAEYNDTTRTSDNTGGVTFINNVGNLELLPNTEFESQVFSVGAFIFW